MRTNSLKLCWEIKERVEAITAAVKAETKMKIETKFPPSLQDEFQLPRKYFGDYGVFLVWLNAQVSGLLNVLSQTLSY